MSWLDRLEAGFSELIEEASEALLRLGMGGLEAAAAAGGAEACLAMAKAAEVGAHGEPDEAAAVRWYGEAARASHVGVEPISKQRKTYGHSP